MRAGRPSAQAAVGLCNPGVAPLPSRGSQPRQSKPSAGRGATGGSGVLRACGSPAPHQRAEEG
eukprot:2659282-Alexandrium_andersonii.AAC.1